MSGFTCDLEIATTYTPAEICGILRDNLAFVTRESDYDPRFPRLLFTTNEALQISVSRRERPAPIDETFGFWPTVTISFEQAKYTEPDPPNEGQVNMVRAVDWIVDHLDGDLVGPPMSRQDFGSGALNLGRTWYSYHHDWAVLWWLGCLAGSKSRLLPTVGTPTCFLVGGGN